MTTFLITLLVVLSAAYICLNLYKSQLWRDLISLWRSLTFWQQAVAVLLVGFFTAYGGQKGSIPTPRKVLSFMFFDSTLAKIFPANVVGESRDAANIMLASINDNLILDAVDSCISNTVAMSAAATLGAATSAVLSVAADWPYTTRPTPANIVISQVWCAPTNVNSVLYEDHYLEFSEPPSEAPKIVIDYRDQRGNVFYAEPITNSFPDLIPITLASGVHSCLVFRVQVPLAFVANLRTWEDEVRFGGPLGSGYGFEIAGLIVISESGRFWRGLSKSLQIGGQDRTFDNGVLMPPLALSASEEAPELSPLLRSAAPGTAKIIKDKNKILLSDGHYQEVIKLAFPIH